MAIDVQLEDAPTPVGIMAVCELREERYRLGEALADRPRVKAFQHDPSLDQLGEAQHELAEVRTAIAKQESWLASHGRGVARLVARDAVKAARQDVQLLTPREGKLV